MKRQALTLTAATALLLWGSALARATLTLKLDDGLGHIVTVADNGSGDSDSTPGSIAYAGAVGNWTVVAGGTSKPVTGSATAPELDLTTLNISSGAGTMEIQLSDTGFTTASPVTFLATIGGTTSGSVGFNTWADKGNALFTETTGLTSQGPFSGSSFSGNQSAVVNPKGSPYSLTLDTIIAHASAGESGFDANLSGTNSMQACTPQPCTPQCWQQKLCALQCWQQSCAPQCWQQSYSPQCWQQSCAPQCYQQSCAPQCWQQSYSPQCWQQSCVPQCYQQSCAPQCYQQWR
jgi:hypothetical protein